jgi:hypothetical protein
MKQRHFITRLFLWMKIRAKLLHICFFDKSLPRFLRRKYFLETGMEVLKFISDRQCTAARQDQCIVARPLDISEWCSRCLALDYLVNEDRK